MGGTPSKEDSLISILLSGIRGEKTVVERDDGSTQISYHRNTVVTSVAIISATTVLLFYLDNGTGPISIMFGKVCIKCQKGIS